MVHMKGQIETLGLLVIVILLVFIGIFALKFMAFDNKKVVDESFYSVKANNLLNAIQKASICDENMEKAIVACFEENSFCGRTDVCSFVEEEINKIIDESLEEDISFTAKDSQYGNIGIEIVNCNAGISSVSSFIRSGYGVYELSLKIC